MYPSQLVMQLKYKKSLVSQTQLIEKGRQEQRSPGAVDEKTDSGTRTRSDSVSFVTILCRITLAIFPSS